MLVKKNACSSNPKIEYHTADMTNLPNYLREGPPFDVVFCNAVLHWLIENQTQSDRLHLKVLKDLSKLVVPKGSFILAFVGQDSLKDLVDASLEITNKPYWKKAFDGFKFPKLYSVDKYSQILDEAGLKPNSIEIVSRDMALSSKEDLVRWYWVSMKSFIGRLSKYPVNEQQKFAKEAVNCYLEIVPPDQEGHPHVDYRDLVVLATKK